MERNCALAFGHGDLLFPRTRRKSKERLEWEQAQGALGMYEQGRREPSLALVVDIASVFGVSTDYLLTGCTRTRQDAAAAEKAMRRCVESARQRQSRLSGDEVAALVAAMLLDT